MYIDIYLFSRSEWLGGAILDVFTKEPLDEKSELWSLPNVTITPHVSAVSFSGDVSRPNILFFSFFLNMLPRYLICWFIQTDFLIFITWEIFTFYSFYLQPFGIGIFFSLHHYLFMSWACINFIQILKYHHHHHVMPPAWISLTISRHFSLSFITSGRSSGLYPVSSHSCCM